LNVSRKSVEQYLKDVRKAVAKGRYRIAMNDNRRDNIRLFEDYVIDELMAKEILLSLRVRDFSNILMNEHQGYEQEELYVFGKKVKLLERYGTSEKTVSLYIKINKLESGFVIVISFHEQNHPINYYFE